MSILLLEANIVRVEKWVRMDKIYAMSDELYELSWSESDLMTHVD